MIKRFVLWGMKITLLISLVLALALTGIPGTAHARSQCVTWHQVLPGENLYRIGLKYGVHYTVIAAANGLPNPNWIYAGQVLCIPAAGSTVAPGAASPAPADTPATLSIPPFVDLLPHLPFYLPIVEPPEGNPGHQVNFWPKYGGRWDYVSVLREPQIMIWTPCVPEAVLYDTQLVCSKTGLGWFSNPNLVPPAP